MSLANWTPAERPEPDLLQGRYVRLERLDWAAHGDGLFEAVCGPQNDDLWTYMPIGPFHDRAAFEQMYGFLCQHFEWETSVICSAASGAVLGMASYMRVREAHGSAEIGCVTFGPALKRTREATEAVYLMAAHLFDVLGYRRFEWKCHNDNLASRRAAERFGFRFEGVFRNDMVVKGKSRDTAWLAMTDEDWPELSAAFKAWLDPDNFDLDGQQKKPLSKSG